jgi:uncharacterized membrane protein
MNELHLHLLINHLPIFGSILGAIVLVQGLWLKSDQVKIAAYTILIISAIGTCIAFFTGDGAAKAVKNIDGINKDMISEHAEFAVFTLMILILLGIISIIGIYLTLRKSNFITSIAILILIISLSSFILVLRTGYLGGKIRHTEINNPN